MEPETNSYSRNWFDFFHASIDDARTNREAEFVCRCAPQPEFQKVLDVCCGMGRHTRALAQRGYIVTGIDREPSAISTARELNGGATYLVADIRDYQFAPETFDAAIVMGQSFGHFDPATNRDVLLRLSGGLRKHGRIVLDLWSPEFFEARQGQRDLKTSRGVTRESKRVQNSRLFVNLKYPDGTEEEFEWQLFTPPAMESFAGPAGLELIRSCSGFDMGNLPSPEDPRIQFVLETR